jgi:ArsR family transcriptional regulator, lead/cadmium/zinc/bismuth-responsive transcriptional repressor
MIAVQENRMDENGFDRHIDLCGVNCIHPQIINKVGREMPPGASLSDLAEFYKIFADRTRIGILWALSCAEMCVCDLCALLDMRQSALSHQLRTLKQARIVKTRREGKVVYYSLQDEHIRDVLMVGMDHLGER